MKVILFPYKQGSENPVNHLLTLWEHVIDKSPAKRVALVAHSYGGVCTLELVSVFYRWH